MAAAGPVTRSTDLLGLVLLGVARREETLGVHLHGVEVGSRLASRGRQTLHLQEGLDVPHFGLVGAVGHRLALGGQDARRLPLGVLRLLRGTFRDGLTTPGRPAGHGQNRWSPREKTFKANKK